jgi:hypothetical protein
LPKYRFSAGLPVLLKLVFVLAIANMICWMGVAFWATLFRAHRINSSSTYPVHFKHGVVVFVPRVLGHYIEVGLWANLLLIAIGVVITWSCSRTGRSVRVR